MIPAAGRPRVVALRDREEVRARLKGLGVSDDGIDIMAGKALFRAVHVSGIDTRAVGILKQEMLSRGGEAATAADAYGMGAQTADCLLLGTATQFGDLLPKLRQASFGLPEIADAVEESLKAHEGEPATHPGLDLYHRPLIMGIVNVTPDSFSDGGDFYGGETAVAEARRMVEQGASLIDVGGESTRPGTERVDLQEELRRVVPVVEALAGDLQAGLSVDTYKAEVAAAALEAGAYMINDISALRFDDGLVDVLRDADCPVVLMHMLGEPRTMQDDPLYGDVVGEIFDFFVERLNFAVDRGIPERNLIIDPGIGFGKNLAHNLELVRHIGTFRSLGRPVLLGASRKRFLGEILGLPEPKDRIHGTVATTVLAALQGVDIVRVHDVEANAQAARVTRAVFAPSQPAERR